MLILKSPELVEEASIPIPYTQNGENLSPPLYWEDHPNKTRSFALLFTSMQKEDAGVKDAHWMAWNIPEYMTALPEGVEKSKSLDTGIQQGLNYQRFYGYTGPETPNNNLIFELSLFALDTFLSLDHSISHDRYLETLETYALDSKSFRIHFFEEEMQEEFPSL